MRYYLLVMGLGMIGMAIWLGWQSLTFIRRTRKTDGVLTGWNETPKFNQPGIVYYYAVVSYEAFDGTQHQVTSEIGCHPKPKVEIGHRYPVRYNLRNPEEARLDTLANLWAPAAGFFVLGSGVILAFLHPSHHH
ncbi:MAG: DUF3592 domain-containing protein [Chthoniobacteraceae bacterium]